MRLLLSADWQWGEYQRLSRGVNADGITTRLQEFVDAWEWMLDAARKHGCEELAVLGDMLDDRAAVPSTVLDTVAKMLWKARQSARVWLLVGNHDAALKSPTLTSLRAFQGMAEIINVPRVVDKVGFVPWTADEAKLSEWCLQVAGEGAEYLLSHVTVRGSIPNADVGIDPASLHPEKFKNVLLGDVHAPLPITDEIQYLGAPLQINFGDAGQPRGVWVLDTDEDTIEFVENDVSPRFWNVSSKADAKNVQSRDYVKLRVDTADAEADVLNAMMEADPQWIHSEFVRDDSTPPRLKVSTADMQEQVLRRYCELQEVENVDEVVGEGLKIIEEARQGL